METKLQYLQGRVTMIKGIGIDVVEMQRMTEIVANKPRFVQKVLTSNEQVLFNELPLKRQVEFMAGRFACKEAFAKAYGTGIGKNLSFHDIEITKTENGQPQVTKSPFDGHVFVTITHTDLVAVGQIILEAT